jgi:F-type H+-transporting ATPase subunit delta
MSNQAVAYRYAKSLIELAEQKGATENIQKDMQLFDTVCNENRAFELAMKSPVVKHLKKLEILRSIFKGKVDPMTMSIFEIITNKNRESILPDLATEYMRQYDVLRNNLTAEITTASILTEAQRKDFIKLVADATGKNVKLTEKVKEDLIGGYVLKVGDKQLDTSVKKKLNDLKVKFTSQG